MHIIEYLIATIAPHRCLSCGLEGPPLCLPCSRSLPSAPKCCYKCSKPGSAPSGICPPCSPQSALQSITVRTTYSGLGEQAIHHLKFSRNRAMAKSLALAMTEQCPPGVLAHIPTANRRVRQRGYDQSLLLTKALATATDNPYVPLLYRRGSQRQLGKSRSVRQQQLRNAFQVRSAHLAFTAPVILVDDVMTTGATFEAAAEILHQMGYHNLHAVAFAWAA